MHTLPKTNLWDSSLRGTLFRFCTSLEDCRPSDVLGMEIRMENDMENGVDIGAMQGCVVFHLGYCRLQHKISSIPRHPLILHHHHLWQGLLESAPKPNASLRLF